MDEPRIVLAHGGGGALTRELVEGVIAPAFGIAQDGLTDAAPVPGADGLVLTTDAFVVKPLFFRGGNIGSLSVHGTVNDLAVSGAEPLAIAMTLIIEEGLEQTVLQRVVESAAQAASACGVRVIAGDTKVVARGEADQLFITTSGVGRRRISCAPDAIREGDCILISGPVADHGVAVMSERDGIGFDTRIRSDSAPVWPFVRALIAHGVAIRVMRDPTRGGLAACCVELAEAAKVTFRLEEAAIPVRDEVRAACEFLGLDPLAVANEGKVVVVVPESAADKALSILRSVAGGEEAATIGYAVPRRAVAAYLHTRHGGERIVEMPYGEELPRIC